MLLLPAAATPAFCWPALEVFAPLAAKRSSKSKALDEAAGLAEDGRAIPPACA